MRRFKILLAGCLLLVPGAIRVRTISSRSLSFEPNFGQAPNDVRFVARWRGYNLALTAEGNRLVLRHGANGLALETRLVGANSTSAIHAEQEQSGKVNYLRGDRALTNIPTYARVRYEEVYPGIDLVYYGNQSKLEYDFVVAPRARPESIAMRIEGADEISLDNDGNLVLRRDQAEITQHKPIVYQESQRVDGKYRLLDNNTVGFAIGSYDQTAPLVIDPVLSYSTFLGGSSGDDDGRGIATDSSGNVYVVGSTTSTNFQTAGPIQASAGTQDPTLGFSDAFVTKLNPTGTALVFSTYLGGTNDDDGNAIAVDSSGNVIIAGTTASTNDFPTTAGAIRRTCNSASGGTCLDAFVSKLNSAGSSLVFSTYLGGTGDDEARGVAVDAAGNAYVTGRTSDGAGGFVTKLSPTGTQVYSINTTETRAIAVDGSGNAYITGSTTSSTTTATDVFVTKLNTTGATLYSQFIRGSKDESGHGIAVDAAGNTYVTGQTSSMNFTVTAGVLQNTFGGGPAFRSSDAGATWTAGSTGITRSSLYALAIAPTTPLTIYAGADDEISGGVFKSTDGGANWTSQSSGLTESRVHALAVDPSAFGTVYAGTRTLGVFKSTNAGVNWAPTLLNNVFVTAIAIDPATPATVYAATDGNGVYKSTNSGASWTPMNNGLASPGVRTLLIDPTRTNTIYAGTGGGIYKSTDAGGAWTSASSGLFDPNINVLVLDPRNPNNIFAATNSVGIFRSVNGGNFWLASNSGLTSSSLGILVSALVIDPGSGTLYAAIGESNTSRIYKSSNGINWTPTSLSTARATALAIDRANSNSVFAATVGGSDAFVAKFDSSGTLVYSTYLGGYRDDSGNGIAVDSSGNVYVAGDTSSTNFPTVSPTQAAFGGGSDVVTDAFVAKFNASGSALAYATYLGGSSNDFAKGIAVDSSGNAYVTGQTGSADFPTASGLTTTRPGLLDAFVAKFADTSTVSYSVAARGGVSTSTQGGSSGISVGYTRIQPAGGSTAPSGLAIFGFRQGNVLVSEAAVPASSLISSGRIYAEVATTVNTGLAIANPNNQAVTLTFYFTDRNGVNFAASSTTIAANRQIAAFLNEAPFNGGASVSGTFTFAASAPVAAIALRGLTNERSEFLITTLPVADLSAAAGTDAILFPHFADGGGWTTQILLVNTTDDAMTGTVQFAAGSPSSYSVPSRSSVKVQTSGQGAAIVTGSVRVTPATSSRAPSGVAVFSYRSNGITVTEAGVPALRAATAFRLYAEAAGDAMQSGVAIANPSPNQIIVTFELSRLNGTSTGLTGTATIPGNGQVSMFLNQIQGFASIPNPFQGVLRVSTASSAGLTVVGLRGRYNERGEFLITTTQPNDESRAAATTEQFFPHFADGGGYTTQFILFNGSADQSSSGSFRFFTQGGQPLSLTVR